MSSPARRDILLSAAVAAIAAFYCFWNLEYPSINTKDEHLHISATQNIFLSGNWLTPRVDGVPYLNKPPFKMWLTQLPLFLFGESNRMYRLPDAMAGTTLVFFSALLAARLFASSVAGLIAGLALISSNTLLFHHGFRVANQDALLLIFLSLSYFFGFRALDPDSDASKCERRKWALFAGALTGAGVLTKSVGGLIAFAVLGIFFLLSRKPREYFSISPIVVSAFLLPALAIPAAYYVPQFIVNREAFETIFVYEVKDRALTGYHNRGDYLFYFKELFTARGGPPPILLAAGAAWALWEYFRNRRSAVLMLLIAAVFPLVFYSAVPSRLPWYIFPMYPAAAVLGGGAFCAALGFLTKLARGASLRPAEAGAAALLSAAVVAGGGYQLARQLALNARQVRSPGELNEVNRLAAALEERRKERPDVRLIVYGRFRWRRDEQPYATRVRYLSERVSSKKLLEESLAEHNEVLLALPASELDEVLELPRRPTGYVKLPASSERKYDLWILSYIPDFANELFSPGAPPSGG